jgi:hypothetical protein
MPVGILRYDDEDIRLKPNKIKQLEDIIFFKTYAKQNKTI